MAYTNSKFSVKSQINKQKKDAFNLHKCSRKDNDKQKRKKMNRTQNKTQSALQKEYHPHNTIWTATEKHHLSPNT